MKLFSELIKEYASSTPEKTAVSDADGRYSYKELDELGSLIAMKLSNLSVRPGDVVSVLVPYGKEIVLGTVSALKAGAVYMPMDEGYPAERLSYMLENSGAAAVLTTHAMWEEKGLSFPKDKVIFLDEFRAGEKPSDTALFAANLTEDFPAMLLYTSGTTGYPKGVLHRQSMLLHIVDWMNIHDGAEMNSDTVSAVITGFTFVGTQMFIIGPLSHGGTVHIAPESAKRDIDFLYRFIVEKEVNHIFIPSALAAILAEDYDISGRFVFAAGEKLRNFKPFCNGNYLYNSYGCTETSGVLSQRVSGSEERMPIGKPFANTAAAVCDEELNILGDEETGELLISNSFMSNEYFKLEEQTKDKWINIDGTLWYKTGDRVRRSKDGTYYILGRTDHMIKIRGFRVETGEVEAQIRQAAEALVKAPLTELAVILKTVNHTDHLVCYYEADLELDAEQIKKEIAKKLAQYMIPDLFIRLEKMPRNANGKVMRNSLPDPESRGNIAGLLDNEVIARVVWTAADILEIDGVDPQDSFKALGGTSVNVLQLVMRLREQGIRISSTEVLRLDIFEDIAAAAEVFYERLWSDDEYEKITESFAKRNERIEKVLPITPEQDEMLFRHIMYPDRYDERYVYMLQLDSVLSEESLSSALSALSSENEELRTAIVFHGTSVIQQAVTDRKIPYEIIKTQTHESSTLFNIREKLLHEPFDLEKDALLKVVCLEEKDRSFLFLRTFYMTFNEAKTRKYVLRLMEKLSEFYPKDSSILDWVEIIKEGLSDEPLEKSEPEKKETSGQKARQLFKVPPEICIYSKDKEPSITFVHTGNTGSAAYYRLADRIRKDVSFAVIEPFNLYHPNEAKYGIKNIAKKYVEILKRHQPKGPYIIGGWCYGGVVAHEMACQLENAGDEIQLLIMLDSHAINDDRIREEAKVMHSGVDREYFETSPLFTELREEGMLENMIGNCEHVSDDLLHHEPSFFNGKTLYFRPEVVPQGISGDDLKFWNRMMEFSAGNYENFCSREKLKVVDTPHEHDLMMDDMSLDIIVPEIYRAIGI